MVRTTGVTGTRRLIAVRVAVTVPRIIIKTGRAGPDGREEELTEYICDTPGCPNVAIHVLGGVANRCTARESSVAAEIEARDDTPVRVRR